MNSNKPLIIYMILQHVTAWIIFCVNREWFGIFVMLMMFMILPFILVTVWRLNEISIYVYSNHSLFYKKNISMSIGTHGKLISANALFHITNIDILSDLELMEYISIFKQGLILAALQLPLVILYVVLDIILN